MGFEAGDGGGLLRAGELARNLGTGRPSEVTLIRFTKRRAQTGLQNGAKTTRFCGRVFFARATTTSLFVCVRVKRRRNLERTKLRPFLSQEPVSED